MASFLADHPIPNDWQLSEDLLDEGVFLIEVTKPWRMFFNGAATCKGAGTGVVFISPQGDVLPYSFVLTQNCSNNMAEYQALILGLEAAIQMQFAKLEVFGDSKLIIKQLLSIYEAKNEDLLPYYNLAKRMLERFDVVSLKHVPRTKNR